MADQQQGSEGANQRPQVGEVGTPRWVKVFVGVAVVLVVLVVVLLATGGHGPGRHTGGQPPLIGRTL